MLCHCWLVRRKMNIGSILSTKDIANRLGIEANLLRVWIHRGKLPQPTMYLSNSPVWYSDVIEHWIANDTWYKSLQDKKMRSKLKKGK